MLRLMLFFPSITFGLFHAEIFPWALVYTAVKRKLWNKKLTPILLLFLFSFAIVLVRYGLKNNFEAIRCTLAYLNPVLIFFMVTQASNREVRLLEKTIQVVLVFFVVLGLCQFLNVLGPIAEIFSFLAPRASSESLGDGRGVTILASEPSRAAVELVFLYSTWRCFSPVSKQLLLVTDLLIFLFVVFILKAATGLSLFLLLMSFHYRAAVLIPGAIATCLALFIGEESRAVSVLIELIKSESSVELYQFLLNSSGFRLVSLLSAYLYAFTSVLGGGIGQWEASSMNAMLQLGIEPESINYFIYHTDSELVGLRPVSYLANVGLDFGLVGIAIFLNFLYPYYKAFIDSPRSFQSVCGLFLFSFFFAGAVGNPIPWICFALLFRLKSETSNVPSIS